MDSKDLNPQEMQDYDDAEETLSFSDLPLNTSFSIEEHERSSFDQDNLFQFFSEDFTASSANYYPTNDIIFCGKRIPVAQNKQRKEILIQPKPPRSNHINKGRIFPWKSNSFSVSPNQLPQEKRYKTCRSFPVMKDDRRHDISRKRAKSRWNLFGSIPMEMKLRDIKTRQNKRKPATMFRYDEDKSEIEMVKNDGTKKLKGLWALLRVFAFA